MCYNDFKSDEVQFVPRNLICGHTYCTGCLNKLAFQARNPGTICCPTCKIETTLFPRTFESVRNLPKNFGVLEILEGKEEAQTDGISKEKENNKYLCPEHDEALKVYCHTDNCLICIYCQVYGKHMGHKCELATSIATTTREELRSLSKKLGDHYDTVKKARRNVIDTRESILNTQQYLRDRIMKHMGVLRACMSRRETVLKCDVDDRTKQKIKPLDEQESMMTEIVNKCETAYSLIQKCQNNDSALVDEKRRIYGLVDEVCDLMEKVVLEPKETSNLTYYFEYDITCILETQIGEIRVLKPGQKEEPLAGLNKHELSGKKEMYDAETQTEDLQENGENPLFHSLLQGLEEIVHTRLTQPRWDESPAPGLPVFEPESPDHSSSESGLNELGGTSDHSDAEEIESDTELEGAVGGETLPSSHSEELRDSKNSEENQTSLLDELQDEIDRLRLLRPNGDVVSLRNGGAGVNTDTTNSEGVDTDNRRQSTSSDEWSLTPPANQGGPLSLDSTLLLPGQRLMSTDGFRSLDSQQCVTRDRTHCFAADCQNPPTARASKRCLHCRHFYCATCASLSLMCSESPSGHRFVSSMLTTRGREQPRTTSRVRKRKPKKEEGPPWECKQCTMINGPQVLVCLGCDTLREVDAQEGHNVCPMCTLVNEPGKTKCELCDTELVSQAQADEADTEES